MVKKSLEGFPGHYRIVRGADYRSVYGSGLKLASGGFVLFGKENRLGHPRLGVTVSRKIGTAVTRNRTKRLFREIFRKSVVAIPHSIDLVVNARRGCAQAGYQDLRKEFLVAVEQLCGRLESAGKGGSGKKNNSLESGG